MPRLAIIGCGALGTILVEHLEKAGDWTLTGVMARTIEHAERLAKVGHCKATTDVNELLADQPDLVVEIAGIGAAKAYGAPGATSLLSLLAPLLTLPGVT